MAPMDSWLMHSSLVKVLVEMCIWMRRKLGQKMGEVSFCSWIYIVLTSYSFTPCDVYYFMSLTTELLIYNRLHFLCCCFLLPVLRHELAENRFFLDHSGIYNVINIYIIRVCNDFKVSILNNFFVQRKAKIWIQGNLLVDFWRQILSFS